MDTKLQALLDKAEIDDLITNFAQGADNPDPELLLSVFAPDARIEFDGLEPIVGRESFRKAMFDGTLKANTRCELKYGTHAMINRRILLNGADEASGIVHAISVLVGERDGAPYSAIRGLHYEDEYRRIDGRWYISLRKHTLRWLIEGTASPLPQGCRLASGSEMHPFG